jgi:SPOR domain
MKLFFKHLTMKYILLSLRIFVIIILLSSCSASTGSRYEKDKEPVETKRSDSLLVVKEDFDISPYKTQINVSEYSTDSDKLNDVWYQFETNNTDSMIVKNGKIIATVDGYRILIIASDNMEEAGSVREEIKEQISRKEVYISFEPPFYKVKVGDFTDLQEANNLKFKLNQLGYTEARVVKETVNLFEQ